VIGSLLTRLGFKPKVRAVSTWYAGVHFASTLEADWAATFDALGMTWSYEPVALRLSNGEIYRCDFWLRAQRTWCEVKGPHDLRIEKPRQLWTDIGGDADDWRAPLVVVAREPEGRWAVAERADGAPIGIDECRRCSNSTFVDLDGPWQCRICGYWEDRTGGMDPVEFARTYRSAARRGAA
jgi:hypothetical protein